MIQNNIVTKLSNKPGYVAMIVYKSGHALRTPKFARNVASLTEHTN